MPLVDTREMFKKAYEGHYAIGAFNINNMEQIQGIVDACNELHSPVILQVSRGARKYAKPIYLKKMVEAAGLQAPASCRKIPAGTHPQCRPVPAFYRSPGRRNPASGWRTPGGASAQQFPRHE